MELGFQDWPEGQAGTPPEFPLRVQAVRVLEVSWLMTLNYPTWTEAGSCLAAALDTFKSQIAAPSGATHLACLRLLAKSL